MVGPYGLLGIKGSLPWVILGIKRAWPCALTLRTVCACACRG